LVPRVNDRAILVLATVPCPAESGNDFGKF